LKGGTEKKGQRVQTEAENEIRQTGDLLQRQRESGTGGGVSLGTEVVGGFEEVFTPGDWETREKNGTAARGARGGWGAEGGGDDHQTTGGGTQKHFKREESINRIRLYPVEREDNQKR